VTPVFQTGQNCLQASIATVLDLDLDDVPNFVKKGRKDNWNWLGALRKWAKKRGLGVMQFYVEEGLPSIFGALVIAIGKTPRGGQMEHAVVCKANLRGKNVNFEYVHDPSGTEAFLANIDYCLAFTAGAA